MITIDTEALPIKVWSEETPEENVMAQARNLANHPLARLWVGLMPDCHLGFGMPIGGVLLTQGGIVPNAVGVDIGCGMIAAQTTIKHTKGSWSRAELEEWRQGTHALVPVGNGPHGNRAEEAQSERLSDELEDTKPAFVDATKARSQAGTLGGGNHFIELQRDEEGYTWLMLHSGSRATGKAVCDRYHKVALQYSAELVPDRDLAYLPADKREHDEYLAEMNWCMKYAEWNRELMFRAAIEALGDVLHGRFDLLQKFETHHNFAATEEHFGESYIVHRKGAVKAEGLVTIPGSMGTASYIGRGLQPVESFNTCSHGAGRVLGRRQANRQITHEEAVASMSHVVFGVRQGDYDETPMAYKDIEQVMRDQADLVEPVHRLKPLAVVKG